MFHCVSNSHNSLLILLIRLPLAINYFNQIHSRAEALVSSLGDNLSHQEKYDATKRQVEEGLAHAKQILKQPLEACGRSDDVIDRKDEHLVRF